jgi:DNA-binding MarR family transcriptional regulator
MNELDKITYELHKKIFSQVTEGIELPVTSTHIYMLNFIRSKGECMVTDIANYLGVTLGAVTSIVDKLIDFKLVNRERSEIDRRLVIIKLSEEGKKLLEQLDIRRKQVLSSFLEGMEQEEIIYLRNIMEKIVAKILNS